MCTMTEHEQHEVIGALVLQRKTLKRLLGCLEAKAHEMSEHLFFAHQVLRGQRPYVAKSGVILLETEPGHHVPLTLPTIEAIQDILAEIENTKTQFTEIEVRCCDLDV